MSAPSFEIVCDGRVLNIVRLESAGEVMRVHVSAPPRPAPPPCGCDDPHGMGYVAVCAWCGEPRAEQ